MAELKNTNGFRVDENMSAAGNSFNPFRSVTMKHGEDRIQTSLTPGKFLIDCEFKTVEIRENIDNKEMQGRLFQKFKGEMITFKSGKDSLDDIEPEHI